MGAVARLIEDVWHGQPEGRPALGWRDSFVTIMMGTWLMLGLIIDGWAHNNLGQLETFFTPWHAIFYSGYLATALWMLVVTYRSLRAGLALPRGYGLGLVGVAVFGLGGFGDMIWHIVFGIEQEIAALLSPTHLLLFLGGVLILSTPLRAAWSDPAPDEAPGFRRFLPVLLSATMVTLVVSFMFMYMWAFTRSFPFQSMQRFYQQYGTTTGSLREFGNMSGIAAVLLTNLFLLTPVLLLLRRWRLPFGSVTLLFGVVMLLMQAMQQFSHTELMLAPLLAGLAADLLIRRLQVTPQRVVALRTFAVVVPLVLWGLYFGIGALRWGMGWAPEMWGGVWVWTGLSGLALSLLIAPTGAPAAAASR